RWDRTGYFVDRTLKFLEKNKGVPCFINLWPDDVHTPWIADKDDMDRNPRGAESQPQFEDVLQMYDKQIGRLFEGLKQLGIDKNTLVIFTSDNGALPTFGFRSGAYRGTKLSLYEGGIRMPFIVRYPGKIKAGGVDSTSVITANDLFPTFCKLASAKMPVNASFDGLDRRDILLGRPSAKERTIFWEYGRNQTSFNYPKGKDRSPSLAIRDGIWKLLVNADGAGVELYNLKEDPSEEHNLAAQQVAITNRLKKKVLTWYNALPPGPETSKALLRSGSSNSSIQ
ncbi:MAG: sulfatase-like hydrolase/transferase, partial [Bacteroidota bacterium]|nr:sulfatase-like hydrolase/transferase [Bacteroidota bacterium]